MNLPNNVAGRDAAFADVLRVLGSVEAAEIASRTDVVGVAPGYLFVEGRITDTPAIVVTAVPRAESPYMPNFPTHLEGVPIEVRPANIAEQIERLSPNFELLSDDIRQNRVSFLLPGDTFEGEERGAALPYVPPTNSKLMPVEEEMALICHTSPDCGWPTLRDFISETETHLSATMYDFNALYIVDAFLDALQDSGTLRLVQDGMGSGSQFGKGYISIEDAVNRLREGLGSRFEMAWAATDDDPRHVTEGFFPKAYHIKTLVRDGKALWLSSGNWRPSSQPNADPLKDIFPQGLNAKKLLHEHNREWHIVVENETLATIFERYIAHDYNQAIPLQNNKESQGDLPQPMPFEVLIPESVWERFRAVPDFLPPKRIAGNIRVEPLLTPDLNDAGKPMFLSRVTELISQAKRRIFLQNQYLTMGKTTDDAMERFVRALAEKSQEPGVEVKILLRDGEPRGAASKQKEIVKLTKMLEALQARGMNMDCVHLQFKTHNKGILIDDEITILGSHNFSVMGATENRDATLVIHSQDVTAYYTQHFLYDWETRSYTEPLGLTPTVVVPEGERGFDEPGFRRLPLPEWQED